jgi:hypothetical protein
VDAGALSDKATVFRDTTQGKTEEGDQKVLAHLLITIEKVTSNVKSAPASILGSI